MLQRFEFELVYYIVNVKRLHSMLSSFSASRVTEIIMFLFLLSLKLSELATSKFTALHLFWICKPDLQQTFYLVCQNPWRPGVAGVSRQMSPLWWSPIDACPLQRGAKMTSTGPSTPWCCPSTIYAVYLCDAFCRGSPADMRRLQFLLSDSCQFWCCWWRSPGIKDGGADLLSIFINNF